MLSPCVCSFIVSKLFFIDFKAQKKTFPYDQKYRPSQFSQNRLSPSSIRKIAAGVKRNEGIIGCPLFSEVAKVFYMEPAEVRKPGNQPLRLKARSLVCYRAVRELGMSGTSVSELLGIGQPAVSRALVREEKLAQDMNLSLTKGCKVIEGMCTKQVR
jgi:hypothetical protein